MRSALRTLLVVTMAALVPPACGSPSSPSTRPDALPTAHYTVTGTVSEVTALGRQPLPGLPMDAIIMEGVGLYLDHGITTTDVHGRYSIANLAVQSVVAVFASGWTQPCPAFTTVARDTVLDVDVTRGTLYPGIARSPRLSGTVYFVQADGLRRPYRDGAPVAFFSTSTGNQINLVRGVTDDEGRFELCGLPMGPGAVEIGYGYGGQAIRKSLVIQGDGTVDIEVPSSVGVVGSWVEPDLAGAATMSVPR